MMIINISVLGYTIPLNIEKKDEMVYRSANTKLTKRIQEYISQYGEDHRELVLAIVAYEMAFEYESQLYKRDVNPMSESVAQLVAKIKEHLDK